MFIFNEYFRFLLVSVGSIIAYFPENFDVMMKNSLLCVTVIKLHSKQERVYSSSMLYIYLVFIFYF